MGVRGGPGCVMLLVGQYVLFSSVLFGSETTSRIVWWRASEEDFFGSSKV